MTPILERFLCTDRCPGEMLLFFTKLPARLVLLLVQGTSTTLVRASTTVVRAMSTVGGTSNWY